MSKTQNQTPKTFPWVTLFRIALTRGLQPDNVWAMTPAALMALLEVENIAPLNRNDLCALIEQYPDSIDDEIL